MRDFTPLNDLPMVPAVYALCSGTKRSKHIAYIGIASVLRRRVRQHLLQRNSSVYTGTSAVALMPEHVTEIWWWEHKAFSVEAVLKAAEQIASELLNPTLRTRGNLENNADKMLRNKRFRKGMQLLFTGEPTGTIEFPTLSDAMSRIRRLEATVKKLQQQIDKMNG